MTDYKHFPRVPRHNPVSYDRLFYVLAAFAFVVSCSMAGHEDMKAQGVIDKQQLLEYTQQVVNHDEQAALYFYSTRDSCGDCHFQAKI